jgi:hypothetical protein
MFVNTIYWYLFNDVVPTEMMGRFVAWFRGVGTLTGALFNVFIFPLADTHMKHIFIGAALLYLVGFGAVCLRIKEGEYPTADGTQRRPTLLDNLKLFASECFTQRFYWYIFLEPSFSCLGGCILFCATFFNQSLGLDLRKIGSMRGYSMVILAACFFLIGRALDRWHPVRAAAYLGAFSAFFALNPLIWLLIPAPNSTLYVWLMIINTGLFGAAFQAVNDAAGMARLMKLLPRDQFGQFSGAMCLVRAVALIIGGLVAGPFMDMCQNYFPHPATGDASLFGYRYMFLFSGSMTIVAYYFHYRIYRSWKRLGGDATYAPPAKGVAVSTLPPRADDDGKVHWPLIGVAALSFLGILGSFITWIVYYTRFNPDPYSAKVFAIAAAVSIALFVAYLCFIKFMERP